MMPQGSQEVTHTYINSQYKIQIERSAVKGVDGFKVEVNSDDSHDAKAEAFKLYEWAKMITTPGIIPAQEEIKEK